MANHRRFDRFLTSKIASSKQTNMCHRICSDHMMGDYTNLLALHLHHRMDVGRKQSAVAFMETEGLVTRDMSDEEILKVLNNIEKSNAQKRKCYHIELSRILRNMIKAKPRPTKNYFRTNVIKHVISGEPLTFEQDGECFGRLFDKYQRPFDWG